MDADPAEQIANAGNTFVPAVLALRAAGYIVTRTTRDRWHAARPGLTLIADDPVELLGLAAMRDARGSDWRATDREIDSVLAEYELD